MELPPHIILAANFAFLFFLYVLFRRLPRGAHRNKRLPPEAGGGLPVIGHLHKLSGTEPTHITLANMADAYGPIFTLRLGMKTALVVSSWEIAKECFTTNDRVFASRPKLAVAELLGYNYGLMGTSPYGPYWRHVRKIATLELLTNHRLDQLQHIRVSEVQTSISKLHRLCADNGVGGKASVEMKAWFEELTLNTIFRMVVGKRFSTAFEGSGGEQYRAALRNFFELFGAFVPSDSFPILRWFDLGGYKKAMKKTAKILDEMLGKWIEEHRETMNNNSGEVAEQDFMGVMLSTIKDDEELFGFDVDTATKATSLAIILGGADTTGLTMTWALSLLLNNQEALKKAQLELDEKVGRQNQVKESDVKNLIYLQAIVKETLRLYPAAPIVPHESMEDCIVSGYHIPAGTRLLVNLQKLQKDPLVWEDPCEFRPERFITGSQNKFDVRGQNLQLIPFGSGRRMCPGISLAIQVMHFTLANLLHGFEIDKPSDELLNMEESFGLTILKKTPLQVLLTPRLSIPRIYE